MFNGYGGIDCEHTAWEEKINYAKTLSHFFQVPKEAGDRLAMKSSSA